MKLLQSLEDKINSLRQKVEEFEKKNREKLRQAYTQMQEAVPSSFAILFSTYNEALSATGGEYQNVLRGLNR